MAMLRREVLLTRAKLHGLCYDQIMGERKLRSLKTQLRQVHALGFFAVLYACTLPCQGCRASGHVCMTSCCMARIASVSTPA